MEREGPAPVTQIPGYSPASGYASGGCKRGKTFSTYTGCGKKYPLKIFCSLAPQTAYAIMPPPRSCASQTGLAFSLGRSPSPLLSGNWTITERRARMPNNRGTGGSERSVIISRAVLSASPRRALNHAIRSATRTLYMNCDASVSGLTCMPPPTQSGRLKDEAKNDNAPTTTM